jgi:hypothetical protein
MISVDVRRWGGALRATGTALLLTLGFGALMATDAVAQRAQGGPEPIRVNWDGTPHPDDAVIRPGSPFQLQGQADLAYTSNRGRGTQHMKLVNVGIAEHYYIGGWAQWSQAGTPSGVREILFQGSLLMSAPRTEWLKHRAKPDMESLNNVLGLGYNHVRTITHASLYQTESWLPADDLLGRVHSGARTQSGTGTCLDHSTYENLNAGLAAAATSDCPETWGSEQFSDHARQIPLDNWIRYFNDVGPDNFHFDWWRVPDEYKEDRPIGDFQTYGKIVDWGLERRTRMGSVMPGGAGAPTEAGWPMGISVKYDAYTFEFPAIANVTFWQALIINESKQVWGQELDYDSLYMGMMPGVLMGGQNAAQYFRPDLGGVLMTGSGAANCANSLFPAGVSGCTGAGGNRGFNTGAAAILVLNSPLGDLRNKNFSDASSPFYHPTHPNAGDTITFNIGRKCGFGVSCWNSTSDRSPRAGYGFVSGDITALLDGRTPAEYDGLGVSAWWLTFRNHDYPTRTARFNQWVPGDWTYNRDATGRTQDRPATPDTLSIVTCLGEEFGGPPGGGCSELWSDTMPGRLNNAWSNIGGVIAFGPFRLAAGDTTRMTFAMVSAPGRASIEAAVANAISAYRSSFLLPSAPPAPRVVSVSTQPGDRGRTARVTIFLDDTPEEFVDQYMLFQASSIEGTQLDEDNPWLVDALRARAQDNLAELRVYKSCNAGRTFTATGNCFGNPSLDEQGSPIGHGWQPYAVFEADAQGRIPNIFTDVNVTAGQRYLYVFVAVSRGFSAEVVIRDAEGNPAASTFEVAPVLMNPLSLSVGDANVVSVYVPASRQAGAQPAAAHFVVDDPRAPTAYTPVSVTLTGDDVPAGRYRVVFGDSVVVTQTRTSENTVEAVVVVHRTAVVRTNGTTERRAYETETYTSVGADPVTTAGGATTGSLANVGDTLQTVYATGLTMVVVTQAGRPLLVSNNLTGAGATPGQFFGRSDFPGFVLSLSTAAPGAFVSFNWMEPSADTAIVLRTGGSPTIRWLQTQASPAPSSPGRQLGEYRIDFSAPEFGPTRLFRLDLINPETTRTAFRQSLEARTPATQTQATEAVAAAIRQTGSMLQASAITVDSLIQVNVPFRITHVNSGREVILAMLASAKRDSITLGTGTQTLTVPVPSNQWVPGEPLILLERLQRFQTDTIGGTTYVVTDAQGHPVVHDSLMVTWNAAVIGCEAPITCNPLVPGTPGTTGLVSHLPVNPDREFLRVRYRPRITVDTRYEFEVTPAIAGGSVQTVTQFDLDEIKVVPNPYVVFSRYEQTPQQRRLMFAGLPPEGTIEIYTVAGQFVQRIRFTSQDLAGNGDLFWNMRTHENNDIASGLYIFVVDGTLPASGQRVRKTGKFVVIRGS